MFVLSEFERMELLGVTAYWLRLIPADQVGPLGHEVLDALKRGREDLKIPALPRETVLAGLLAPPGGLLSHSPSQLDQIELAFHLWIGRHEPFFGLTEKAGLYQVFSAVGWLALNNARPSSLIRLNAFLADALVFFAEAYRKDAARFFRAWNGLVKGPKASAKKRGLEKLQRRAQLHAAANDYRRQNPSAKNSEIANFLSERGFGTVSSITKFLGGTKQRFLSDLATQFQK